ncbi:MAG: MazG-like family protein [Patescibacteria group bacterium]|nr:MazG-like family protein [Patescibacteria group bacterium]
MKDLSFKETIDLTRQVINRFKEIEGRPWGIEGAMIELSKQVGQLSRLVMSYEGYYFPNRENLDKQYESTKEKIGDELSDIFYAIVRIADHYDINLEQVNLTALTGANKLLDSIDKHPEA